MYMTQNRFGLHSANCIEYRGYYILTNHDDSQMAITADLDTILKKTSSLCEAYLFIDTHIDGQKQ